VSFLEESSQALKTYSKGAPFYNVWVLVRTCSVIRLVGHGKRAPFVANLHILLLKVDAPRKTKPRRGYTTVMAVGAAAAHPCSWVVVEEMANPRWQAVVEGTGEFPYFQK
jgi:hypothetical protein